VYPSASKRSHRWALTRRVLGVLPLAGVAACSVEPAERVTSNLDASGIPTECPPGTTCPLLSAAECFGIEVSCSQGDVSGTYGPACTPIVDHCELGCRKDYAPNAVVSAEGSSSVQAHELGQTLCEEYRLLAGAHRPGDACSVDYDCLPYAPGSPKDGMPWPELLSCVDGECREGAPSVPGDFGAACTPDTPPSDASAYSAQGIVVPGSCENGLCNIGNEAGNDVAGAAGHCTLQCKSDAGCPRGWVCWGLSIGPILDPYSFGTGNFCVDPCSWLNCGGTGDAGAPDAQGAPSDDTSG
jgi:hypothetical protein